MQDACIRTDGNIVIFPASERRKTGGQVETVQITGDCTRSLRNLFCLKIIARVERERPVIRNLYISVCIDVMRIRIRISHGITVNRLRPIFTDIKRIAKAQRPRHLKHLITIRVCLCFLYFLRCSTISFRSVGFFIITILRLLIFSFSMIFSTKLSFYYRTKKYPFSALGYCSDIT